jgi:hypothetical protein
MTGVPADEGAVGRLIARARREPVGVDLSDFSDTYVEGFLAGQASILEELDREPDLYGVELRPWRARTPA